MLLVTGAGGKTGRAVIRALADAVSVSAFVHRQDQAPIIESLGVGKVLIGDMCDAAAVRSAMRGVRKVYHICPNMHPQEAAIGRLVIEAAREAGVEQFVYHSVLHPQTEKMPHHWAKLRVEELLFESGLPFTILQPGPYMQNLLTGWKSITELGVLRVPYAVEARFSFVDLEDVAAAARVVLAEARHAYATYELAGTPPRSIVEAAEIIARLTGRPVRAEREAVEAWKARTKGISEQAIDSLVKMFAYYDKFGLTGNPNQLRWLLSREPNTLESFFRRVLLEQNAIH